MILNNQLIDSTQKILIRTNGNECFNDFIPSNKVVSISLRNRKSLGDQSARKNSKVEGLLNHVFSKKFILVVGSKGTSAERSVNKKLREEFVRIWKGKYFYPLLVKRDVEISQKDIETSNLLLIGTINSNIVLQKIADSLPIKFNGKSIVIGDTSYYNPDVGIRFVYLNPLNPNKYVAIYSGISEKSLVNSIKRFGLDGWYNIMVYDENTVNDYTDTLLEGF